MVNSNRKPSTKKFRDSAPWKGVVVASSPMFHWVWKHIFNFKEKQLYLSSRIPKREIPQLRQEGIFIVRDDPTFAEFAQFVRKNIGEENLSRHEAELRANPPESGFFGDFLQKCDPLLKFEILKFALSDKVLEIVLPYFGMLPKLNSIMLLQNIVRPEQKQEGSMQWHRDSDHYRSLNLFMCISDVDDDTGPYHAISAKAIPYEAVIPFYHESESSNWKKWRVPDEVMNQYVSTKYHYKLTGNPGLSAFVDPGSLYHKGGHCLKKNRLMLQISFATNTPGPIKNIVNSMGLKNYPGLVELLDTKEKTFMAMGDEDGFIRRLGIKNPTYMIGKKVLHYNMKKEVEVVGK